MTFQRSANRAAAAIAKWKGPVSQRRRARGERPRAGYSRGVATRCRRLGWTLRSGLCRLTLRLALAAEAFPVVHELAAQLRDAAGRQPVLVGRLQGPLADHEV